MSFPKEISLDLLCIFLKKYHLICLLIPTCIPTCIPVSIQIKSGLLCSFSIGTTVLCIISLRIDVKVDIQNMKSLEGIKELWSSRITELSDSSESAVEYTRYGFC